MEDVNLPKEEEIDVIFSNAALHWVVDQEGVFSHFWRLLKPNGGELLLDYGGHGNVERILSIIFKLKQSDQFREYFVNWKKSWYFAKPDETEKLLHKLRFRDIQVNLSSQTILFSDRQSFATFVRTVIMKPILGYLPDDKKREQFLHTLLNEFESAGWGWSLDFSRLSVYARKIST